MRSLFWGAPNFLDHITERNSVAPFPSPVRSKRLAGSERPPNRIKRESGLRSSPKDWTIGRKKSLSNLAIWEAFEWADFASSSVISLTYQGLFKSSSLILGNREEVD